MRSRMAERGHTFITPTHTGLGERSHLAHPDVDLEFHIADILAVLEYEDLTDVIMVGHSYGATHLHLLRAYSPRRSSQAIL